jgi:thiol-disulfide isomerase/thioredoxin
MKWDGYMKYELLYLVMLGLWCNSQACEVSAQTPPAARPQIVQGNLQNADVAPDFTLQALSGAEPVTLSKLRGKPVVLVFGSCTCPPFVAATQATEQLYAKFQDRVHFYLIYVREAHPTDGRVIPGNQFQIRSPQTPDERERVAGNFARELGVQMPILIDGIDNAVERVYACWPNRMYVIDAGGKIMDKGMAGPGGVSASAKRATAILDHLLAGSE